MNYKYTKIVLLKIVYEHKLDFDKEFDFHSPDGSGILFNSFKLKLLKDITDSWK